MGASAEDRKQRLLDLSAPAFRLAVRVLGRSDGAEDVVQQAYLAALSSLPKRLPPEGLRAWFLGVVVNKARMYARGEARRARREAAVDLPDQCEPAADMEHAERVELLRHALSTLEEKYRLPAAASR